MPIPYASFPFKKCLPGVGLLLTLGLVPASSGLRAQPTLTASANALTAPLPYTFWGGQTLIPEGPSGANQVWDFSSYASRPIDKNRLVACAATPYCGLITRQGTIADTTDNSYKYFLSTSAGIEQVAEVSFNPNGPDTFLTVYTNTDIQMKFPFRFQDHYNDPHLGRVYDNGSVVYGSSGYDSVYADGWGTIVTAGGTYSNVLRIRQTIVDSSLADNGDLIGVLRKDLIDWYQPGSPRPVFRIETDSLSSPALQDPFVWSWYGYNKAVAPNRTGIAQAGASGITAAVYPNPADQEFRLSLQGIFNRSFMLNVTDMTGRAVFTRSCRAGNSGFDEAIDAGRLAPGLYNVNISAENLHLNTRLSIR